VTPAPFHVQSEQLEDGIRVFAVRGELDMNAVPELEAKLAGVLDDQSASVMLDLSECEFIDSTGIALIVRSWQRLDRNGGGEGRGRFVLCCIDHQVRRLLRITGVETSISLHEQRDEAVAELQAELQL
jgi:anti-sigma B factor antagonist